MKHRDYKDDANKADAHQQDVETSTQAGRRYRKLNPKLREATVSLAGSLPAFLRGVMSGEQSITRQTRTISLEL